MTDYNKRHKPDTYSLLAPIDINGGVTGLSQTLGNRLSMVARTSVTQLPSPNAGLPPTGPLGTPGLFGSSRRRSVVGTPRNGRRVSMAPLVAVSIGAGSGLGAGAGSGVGAGVGSGVGSGDPRPLRDKTYQTTIQQHILNHLITHRFETIMKHPISVKSLRQPTQKDFVLIFQFLYRQVDQGYTFSRSIEYEVYHLLRTIRYPYLDTINKSQISAVGGQNWPVFLGMLYWLVQLNTSLELLDVFDFEDVADQLLRLLTHTEDIVDGILSHFIFSSYKAFLQDEDEFSTQYAETERKISSHNEKIAASTAQLDDANDGLLDRLNALTRDADTLASAEQKSQALEGDLVKFRAYISTMEQRKQKWATVLNRIKTEIESTEKELKAVQADEARSAQRVEAQGLSPGELDRMALERSRLAKNIDLVNSKLSVAMDTLKQREAEAQQALESLESVVKRSNTTVYKIQSLSSTLISSVTVPEHNFEIRFVLENMLQEDRLGLRHDQILTNDLKTEKIRLLDYRKQISTNTHKHQDEAIKLQEKLDLLGETVNEKTEAIESLEARVASSRVTYEELYESFTNDATTASTEVEKLERELQMMKIGSAQGLLRIEQRVQSVKIEHDQEEHRIQGLRERLHSQVELMIEFCISFKLNVQENLDEFEVFVNEQIP